MPFISYFIFIYNYLEDCPNKDRVHCLNEGYLSPHKPGSKACSCVCPPNTKGKKCEIRSGDYYGNYACVLSSLFACKVNQIQTRIFLFLTLYRRYKVESYILFSYIIILFQIHFSQWIGSFLKPSSWKKKQRVSSQLRAKACAQQRHRQTVHFLMILLKPQACYNSRGLSQEYREGVAVFSNAFAPTFRESGWLYRDGHHHET